MNFYNILSKATILQKHGQERATKSDRENRKEENKKRRTKIEKYAFTNERKRRKKSIKSKE